MRFLVGLWIGVAAFGADVAALRKDPAVVAALADIKATEEQTIADQVRLCEIPAPPFKEQVRAAAVKADFEKLGLKNVRIDREGNVIGERPGAAARPNLVFSAHLDTVFPEGTDVKVKRDGAVLKAPGIGDDSRGLGVLLAVIRAFEKHKVNTPGTITFVATVGEEGLGDLRGVKHLFGESLKGKIDAFVSVDGTALSTVNVGVGSYRYLVKYKGPGGHSYGSFGNANPIHALGRAIDKIADFDVPKEPKTTFNVGRISGGTSVNSIAFEATCEVDMRSSDPAVLKALDEKFKEALKLALSEENERWKNRGKIDLELKLIGDRAAGFIAPDAAVIQMSKAVSAALGL